jgi:hypothetical protein
VSKWGVKSSLPENHLRQATFSNHLKSLGNYFY